MIDINKKIIDSNNDQLNNYDEDWDDRADFAFYQQFEDFVNSQKKSEKKNDKFNIYIAVITTLALFISFSGVIISFFK